MGEAGIDRGPAHLQSSIAVYHDVLSTPGGVVLTARTMRATNIITSAGQITLPSIAAMLAAGFPPGAQFTFLADGVADLVTIVPNAADLFSGFGVAVVLQPSGSSQSVQIQLDIQQSGQSLKWKLIDRSGMHSRSISVAALATTALVLTTAVMRDTIVLAPTALQTATLPSVAAMLAAGFVPGQTISIVKGTEAFASTIAPNAADTISGGNLILPADVESGVILQMPESAAGAWVPLAATRQGRSTTATLAGVTVLTSSTIRDSNKFTNGGAVLSVALPVVSTLIAAGYRVGQIFAFCKGDAGALTVTAGAGDSIFGGAISTTKGANGAILMQMPAALGEWLVLASN